MINIIKRLIIYYFLLNFLHFIINVTLIHSLVIYISPLIRNYYIKSNLINLMIINYSSSHFEARNFMINYYYVIINY